ncbi:Major Facilitator Superfamily (MFS) [Thraustotheca clavata]|uniref:Lysosomal dipeptide transporter MFSD1 n=1 Tax=Thraustotheca clavata TaxID=74557 RepID=A0A1V9Z941_9STRA|nr:Major Facilitator Superfamily (MFS) [Thraustotheca clavata]
MVTEQTLLLQESCIHPVPSWRFWNVAAPGHRFYLLVLICFIPFGGHFVKNEMSSLEQLMLDDTAFPISNTVYGAFNSAVSIPNMIIPFFGGRILDCKGHLTILYFLLLMCAGQALFAYAMELRCLWLAMAGRIIFGLGEGSVVAGGRAIVSYWFDRSELTFAMGTMVGITNISKILAKATVAPIAIYFGSYIYGLWYGLIVCVLSTFVALLVGFSARRLKQLKRTIKYQIRAGIDIKALVDPSLKWLSNYCYVRRYKKQAVCHANFTFSSLRELSPMFWLVVLLHVLFINVFHLFQNISSSYFHQVHGYSIVNAGYVSSLGHLFVIFAPIIGLVVDCIGGRMHLILLSSCLSILAYALLVFTNVSPIISMLLISLCLSVTPTILMATIPLSISKHRFGTAFGIVEVVDAVGAFIGNLVIGYLRDTTGSYTTDMILLFTLACLTLLLSIILAIVDQRNGGHLAMATLQDKGSDDEIEADCNSSSNEGPTAARIYV